MSDTIESLKRKIKQVKAEEREKLIPLEESLQEAYERCFTDMSSLVDAINAVTNARTLEADARGVFQWKRHDLSIFNDEGLKEALTTYLENFYVTPDFQYNILQYHIGGYLEITATGDVFDVECAGYSKLIVEASSYRKENGNLDIVLRNSLIEKYMNDAGYFPGIVESDKHGNFSYVDLEKGE